MLYAAEPTIRMLPNGRRKLNTQKFFLCKLNLKKIKQTKKAVCCQDHIHCCPEGTRCDLKAQSCVSTNGEARAWSVKATAKQMLPKLVQSEPKLAEPPVICKDNSTCPPLSTCCEFGEGMYACCQYDEAVCCDEYCCLKGFTCGVEIGDCVDPRKLRRTFNWHRIELKAAQSLELLHSESFLNVVPEAVCPGGEVPCDQGTCCQKGDSSYACCPYEKGTCCGSHGYCCPQGYTCDPKMETCTLNGDDDAKFGLN